MKKTLICYFRARAEILHFLVYKFAQKESYDLAQPLVDVQEKIIPEDDVTLNRSLEQHFAKCSS